MAPATSPKALVGPRNGIRVAASPSNSREATPVVTGKMDPVAVAKGDSALASIFKTDLTSIKSLVTCSICDQLLYEPYTLGCGHTYCYSCLCNWLVPNKKKKTCPECRELVKEAPAPSFLVKQVVQVFLLRSDLMPSDETIEQHQKRRLEEAQEVERDRNSQAGLFRGAFLRRRELILDEQDGVFRCPGCLQEYEGGSTCAHCHLLVESGYNFSDGDGDDDSVLNDLDNLEVNLDEVEHHYLDIPHFSEPHFYNHGHRHHHHHLGDSVISDSDNSDVSDEESDDDNSLNEFVVPDDEEPGSAQHREPNDLDHRPAITISDDESDEGGEVSNRRMRRAGRPTGGPSRSEHEIVELDSSDVGDQNAEALMLQNAGWSPLSQEDDSDLEQRPRYGYDYATSGGEPNSDDGSDTETIGNGGSDDGDNRPVSELSATPQYDYPLYGYVSEDEDEDDNSSDAGLSSVMDGDGDTEMSVSAGGSRASRGLSVNTEDGYGYDLRSQDSRSESVSTGGYDEYGVGENLGPTTQMYDPEDDSSDSSIRPPPTRIRRQLHLNPQVQQYFAEHQQSIRGVHAHEATGFDDGVRRTEPGSRTRRMNSYRHPPARRADPLRSSRSPSANRVISSSIRTGRVPRQYLL